MSVIGIDVSKTTLDWFHSGSGETRQFPNTRQGFTKLLKGLGPDNIVILEATGGYERGIVKALHQAKIPLAVVNPKRVRDFAKSLGKLAKTDCLDARVLAQFGTAVSVRLQEAPTPEVEQLNRLNAYRQDLKLSWVQYRNRLQQADEPWVRESLQQVLNGLKEQLKATDKQSAKVIQSASALKEKAQLLLSVAGVGEVLTAMLLGNLPELGHLSGKEVSALVGVAPFNCDSGQLRGQRKIWGGRKEIRNVLFMAANRARIHDPEMNTYYEQLRARGKAFKVALVACMRKLLVRLNAKMRDFLLENPGTA